MTGPIPFPFSCVGSHSLLALITPPASPRDDALLVPRGDRDDPSGHLVDLLSVALDLLHPLRAEPVLDRADDRVLPAQEVAVPDEAVDQLQEVPRDPDRDGVATFADRLDEGLHGVADQLGPARVRLGLTQERIDELEVLLLEPQRDPFVLVPPRPPFCS